MNCKFMETIFIDDCKEKKPDKTNVFESCDAKQQVDLEEVVSEYDIFFQELKGLLPKKEIVHDINLQQDAPLPNIECTSCLL